MDNKENANIENEDNLPNENNTSVDAQSDTENKAEDSSNSKQEGEIADNLNSLENKNKELNDKYLRLYSDFDNFRKRTAKERIDLIKTAGEDFFKSFLPIIDDFERAIKANENAQDIQSIKEGINLIYQKIQSMCKQKGLEVMDSIGKPFDAEMMEAITNIASPSEEMKGKVIDEVEKGYKLGDKVIRYAKVIIAN